MIADTTWLSDFQHERESGGAPGRASALLAAHRAEKILITVGSIAEIGVIFPSNAAARSFLSGYRVLRLTPEVAWAAADVDRELIERGERLGENDNWIAGFCRYYGQPLVSRDGAFDRVRGLRRLPY
jgi:predicted nucleic acid-binding protein